MNLVRQLSIGHKAFGTRLSCGATHTGRIDVSLGATLGTVAFDSIGIVYTGIVTRLVAVARNLGAILKVQFLTEVIVTAYHRL
jgi:hypothetical protein